MSTSKAPRIIGWVLSGLLGLVLIGGGIFSAFFLPPEQAAEGQKMTGLTAEVSRNITLIMVGIGVLFLIPRTAFIAAILLTAYMGGAVFVHVREADGKYFFAIIFAVFAWVALGLREPGVFRLAFGGRATQ